VNFINVAALKIIGRKKFTIDAEVMEDYGISLLIKQADRKKN
jgi:hypothetical protein